MNKEIVVKNIPISFISRREDDYISLTDIARYRNKERTERIVQNWLRTRNVIEFMGLWEQINNPNFKHLEFEVFKNESGSNSFSVTPKRWIDSTEAIGLITKSGRYGGGTYAHKDIALEFASWISPEFKLYLIKEFQRLKVEEAERKTLGWDVKRMLTKVNYRIHTDAIKKHIIPPKLSKHLMDIIYASEADVLNMAIFGMTAKEWRDKNSKEKGNIRDCSTIEQLVVLSNMESMNAEFIRQGLSQGKRLEKLNEIAIYQMTSLVNNQTIRKLTTEMYT
jgi:hypothetical protein